MAIYTAFQPGVEVNGETILSFLDGMGGYSMLFDDVLQKNGIHKPEAGRWYSQQAWLDSFKSISAKTGPATLKRIGANIPANAKWPPDVNSIPSALMSIDVAYHMNHRNGQIGHYACTITGQRSATLACDNPYPCQFDQGIIEATAKKFAKLGERVLVRHDETKSCRMSGGDSCTYLVSW